MAFSNLKQSISIIRQSKSINENTAHFDLDFDPCNLNKHLTLFVFLFWFQPIPYQGNITQLS